MSSTPELLRESRHIINAVQRDQQALRDSASYQITTLRDERHQMAGHAMIVDAEICGVDPAEVQREMVVRRGDERGVVLTPGEMELRETLSQNDKLMKIIEELQQELLESNKTGEEMQGKVTKVRFDMDRWRIEQNEAQQKLSGLKPTPSIPEEEIQQVKQDFLNSKSMQNQLHNQISQVKLQKDELVSRLRKAIETVTRTPELYGRSLKEQAQEKEKRNLHCSVGDPISNEAIFKLEEHVDVLEKELKIVQRENSILQEDNRRWTEDLLMANQMLLKAKKRLQRDVKSSTLASLTIKQANENQQVTNQMVKDDVEVRRVTSHQGHAEQDQLAKVDHLATLITEYDSQIIPCLQHQIAIEDLIIDKLESECRRDADEEVDLESDLLKRQLENSELKSDLEKTTRADINKSILEDK